MVAAVITETSKTLALVGGYMCIVGLITFWFKDKFFLCTFFGAVAKRVP